MDKLGIIFLGIVVGIFAPVICFTIYGLLMQQPSAGNWTSVGTMFMPLAIGTAPIAVLLYLYTLIRRRKKKKEEGESPDMGFEG